MRPRWLAAGVFLALLLAVPAYEVAHRVWPGRGVEGPFSAAAVLSGELTSTVEGRLDQHARLPGVLRPHYNLLLFDAFRETTEDVTVGRDDWLFLTATVRNYPPPGTSERLPAMGENIAALARLLQENGCALVVLLVPNKASMCAEFVPPVHPPFRPGYDLALAALRGAGVDVIDPRPALVKDGAPLYMRADTHWTHEGALAVAQRVRDHVVHRFGADGCPGTPVAGEIQRVSGGKHAGDLLVMLGLPVESDRFQALLEPVESFRGVYPGTSRPLEFTEEAVVLAGTSFSHGFHTAANLSALLKRRVQEVISKGSPLAPLEPLQDARLGRRPMPELLIWEMPERFLFLNQQEFTTPLENLRRLYEYGPAELPVAVNPVKLQQLEGEVHDGAVHAQPMSSRPRIIYRADRPLPADGSLALVFELVAPRSCFVRFWVEGGPGNAAVLHQVYTMGMNIPHVIVIPVANDGGHPVTHVGLDPVQYQEPFRVGRMRVWRR